MACESERNFLSVKGPELLCQWVGESEKAVKATFKKARDAAPSILFFDEIDSIAAVRGGGSSSPASEQVSGRVLSQLLLELDGIHELRHVAVIAATNRPDLIDPALLRPGRIDRLLLVAPPSRSEAEEVLQLELSRMAREQTVTGEAVMAELSRVWGEQQLWSGAELVGLCREAGLAALEEAGGGGDGAVRVGLRHVVTAVSRVSPRLDEKMLRFYSDYERQHAMQSV